MLIFPYPPMGDMEGVDTMQHEHDEQSKKTVVNRLSRAIGHLESVKLIICNELHHQ